MEPEFVPLTPGEYLERELRSPFKHEYVDGAIYAMSGASRRHNLIAARLVYRASEAATKRANCQVFGSDMRVRVEARNCYYYPDLSACCDPTDRDDLYVLRPCFIVEVSSFSTAAIDRREKRIAYLCLDSLREYAIVDQDRLRVEVYRREGTEWRGVLLNRPEDVLVSTCLGMHVALGQLYDGVEFPPGVAEPEPCAYSLDSASFLESS